MENLRGKRLLITGASSGIGEALAQEAGRRGARVGLLARRAERLEALHHALEGRGVQSAWAIADVADTEATQRALDTLAEALGGCDIVVANAGYGRPEAPKHFQPGRALAMYDVNLFGMLRTIDWALPRFLEQRAGQIVGIASVASFLALPHAAAYCGSKVAMRFHLESLGYSLAPRGIAVTTICPGFVKSELTDLNKGPMPFKWPTERAAKRIATSIERRVPEDIFPWQMKLLVAVVTRLPRALRAALLRRMPGI